MGHVTVTQWIHNQLLPCLKDAGLCLDATAGNGNDTLFLCKSIKESGIVLAFDIQQEAVDHTKALLLDHGFQEPKCRVVLDGHEHMDKYAAVESVDVIVFNLGYLPGGDHAKATRPKTTAAAIEKGLKLLKTGGIMSICIYSGGDSGYEERDALIPFLEQLDASSFTVIRSDFCNKPNDPPIPVLIIKDKGIKP